MQRFLVPSTNITTKLIQWLKKNPGCTIAIYQVTTLFNHAYENSATKDVAETAISHKENEQIEN